MPRKPPFTQKEIQRIKTMFWNEKPLPHVAKRLGYKWETLREKLIASGVPVTRGPRRTMRTRLQRFAEEHQSTPFMLIQRHAKKLRKINPIFERIMLERSKNPSPTFKELEIRLGINAKTLHYFESRAILALQRIIREEESK